MASLMFIEPEKGSWYYLQERPDAWANAWDWREEADAFGPFTSYEEACDHQYDHQNTTSGAEVWSFEDNQTASKITDVVLQKIALAPANMDTAERIRF
jgi:hypothetical protein